MAATKSCEGDPGAGACTTFPCSGRSSYTTPAAPRRVGDPEQARTISVVCTDLVGLEMTENHSVLVVVEVSRRGAPAPADGFEEAALGEALLRIVAACGGGSMPVGLSGRDVLAFAGTGSAFSLVAVVYGLAAAAGGRGGGRGRWDGEAYRRATRPRPLTLAPTQELVAQLSDPEKGTCILVGIPGCVNIVKGRRVSLEAIKYPVTNEAHMMLYMGIQHPIDEIYMENTLHKSENTFLSKAFQSEMQVMRESDKLDCKSKPKISGSSGGTRLYKQCSNGFSVDGAARYLFILIMSLLVLRTDAQLLNGSDHVKWMESNSTNTCPARPYQSKRSVPICRSCINEDNRNLLHSFVKAKAPSPPYKTKCGKKVQKIKRFYIQNQLPIFWQI